MIDQISQKLNAYCAIGFKIFPCKQSDKRPLTNHSFLDASNDPIQIGKWVKQFPECAWGAATSSIHARVDIDPRHNGHATWQKLIEQHGNIPETPTVRTGGNGHHYSLSFPDGTGCSKLGEGIDLKSDGGYVIIPPSKIDIPEHGGRDYSWEVSPYTAVANAPEWLVELSKKPLPTAIATAKSDVPKSKFVVQADGNLQSHPGSPEGERRVTLLRLVGSALANGVPQDAVWQQAERWAATCNPPFDEWRKHVAGLLKKEEAKGNRLLTSFQIAETGAEKEESMMFTPPPIADAFHGLLGQIAKAIEPELEPNVEGFLLNLLSAFGHCVGIGPSFAVLSDLHHANLNTCLVGETSSGKGQCWTVVRGLMRQADSQFQGNICSGLSSGEGLIQSIADDENGTNKKLLCNEQELAKVIRSMRREGNTLSAILRSLWDCEPVESRTKIPIAANNAFLSILSSITPKELARLLDGSVEVVNGFANRFLWCEVQRVRHLPEGGDISVLKPFIQPLAKAIANARSIGLMRRSPEAIALWREAYPNLVREKAGEHGVATSRSRPQVLRLSMLYALADGQAVIGEPHLRAALALWEYCDQTAGRLFGGVGSSEPEPLWLKCLNMIQSEPGIARSAITYGLKNSAKADAIGDVLEGLKAKGMATCKGIHPECWFPVDLDGDGEKAQITLSPSPFFVSADGKEGRRESAVCPEPSFLPSHESGKTGTEKEESGDVEPLDDGDTRLAKWIADAPNRQSENTKTHTSFQPMAIPHRPG